MTSRQCIDLRVGQCTVDLSDDLFRDRARANGSLERIALTRPGLALESIASVARLLDAVTAAAASGGHAGRTAADGVDGQSVDGTSGDGRVDARNARGHID